jgi:hypothetical protein
MVIVVKEDHPRVAQVFMQRCCGVQEKRGWVQGGEENHHIISMTLCEIIVENVIEFLRTNQRRAACSI